MSRSGYIDDIDSQEAQWALIRWRGAVNSALRGRRGQRMLRELLEALDAMPEKALAADSLVTAEGEYCALGALGAKRGIDMKGIDPEDHAAVSETFGVAPALAREIVYENDECAPWGGETPEARWKRMRAWVAANIKQPNA